MFIINFVREFRDQYAVAHPVTKAAFTALYTGTAAAYVGWATLPAATVIDTTTMAVLGVIIGASIHAVSWCLGRMIDVAQAEEHAIAIDSSSHID